MQYCAQGNLEGSIGGQGIVEPSSSEQGACQETTF